MQQKSASILANASRASAKRMAGGKPSQSPAACYAAGLGSTSPANSIRSPNGCQTSRIQREPMAPAPSIRQRYRFVMPALNQADHAEYRETVREFPRLVPPVPWTRPDEILQVQAPATWNASE